MYYFDWTATTPASETALEEYYNVSKTLFGNPSSNHPLGFEAKDKLESCRNTVAKILHAKPSDMYFTSGGTESNSIILNALLKYPNPGEIITTAIEHSAVLEHKSTLEALGWKFTTLPCPNGYLNPQTLKSALNDKVRMVCIMAVNNVVGSVQDLKSCISVIRDFSKTTGRKIHIHSDAVQAVGKIDFNLSELDLDSAAVSAHKFYGPRGVGILYNRNNSLQSLSKGGGQEAGLRPGTENLPAVAAMTSALEDITEHLEENFKTVTSYHDTVLRACLEYGYSILSPQTGNYSPYILTVGLKTAPAEVFLRILADKGFCLSAGSACSSQTRSKTEGVLAAMNISPELRRGAIRISFSSKNTEEDVSMLVQALKEAREELK